jgi:uncharacterized protein with ParB-like and HNH nuclease domain
LDSLFKGNPVGMLLLWRSKNHENSDPFALTILVGAGKSSENRLIVDGQQRVLSLLLLLNGRHVKVATRSTPNSTSNSTLRSASLRWA